MQQAIDQFATTAEAHNLQDRIEQALATGGDEDDAGDRAEDEEISPREAVQMVEAWDSGVEHLKERKYEDLLADLNVINRKNTTLPDFNVRYDKRPLAVSPWDEDEWAKIERTEVVQPLTVR